ncbi:21925_t:CDS:2, partial [Cetraspora pellucida]
GESKGSESLTVDECLHILNHNCTSPDTSWGLFNRVFFFNALFFALRGGEHYFLEKDHFQKRKDGGYDILIYKSKTNQCGIDNPGQADRISVPNLDHINSIYDKYFIKRPVNADPHFYLQAINSKPEASGIDITGHKITNQSGRKTTIQLLKSFGASDYECMTISRHKSQAGFQQYERPKNNVQITTLDSNNLLLTKKATITAPTQVPNSITAPTFISAKKILQVKFTGNSGDYLSKFVFWSTKPSNPLEEMIMIANKYLPKCSDNDSLKCKYVLAIDEIELITHFTQVAASLRKHKPTLMRNCEE